MVDHVFYRCIGGPLDGGSVSRVGQTIQFQSEEGSTSKQDALFQGGGLESFHRYQLTAHVEYGHVWIWPED